MSDLKTQLIKLGTTNPELRPHIREVLGSITTKQAAWTVRDPKVRQAATYAANAISKEMELDLIYGKADAYEFREDLREAIMKSIVNIVR